MSEWAYVAIGWITTYAVIGIWYYTSRAPENNENIENVSEIGE